MKVVPDTDPIRPVRLAKGPSEDRIQGDRRSGSEPDQPVFRFPADPEVPEFGIGQNVRRRDRLKPLLLAWNSMKNFVLIKNGTAAKLLKAKDRNDTIKIGVNLVSLTCVGFGATTLVEHCFCFENR